MIGIISVTKKGDLIALKLRQELGGKIYLKSEMENFKLDKVTKEAFLEHKYIVFISSTGIAVRGISKYIKSKDLDPGVIVVDVCNNFTISLLSGHLGGANELTFKISKILKNTAVITTATDNLDIVAPDIFAKSNELVIEDLKKAKYIASRLVNEEVVYFYDKFETLKCPKGYVKSDRPLENSLIISNNINREKNSLVLFKKNIILGIGCKRGTKYESLKEFVLENLESLNLDYRSVKVIGSIDLKKDEEGLLKLSEFLKVEPKFFKKEEILEIEDRFEGSQFVKKITGVSIVCEPVVELLRGKIILKKTKKNGMTLSIGILKEDMK